METTLWSLRRRIERLAEESGPFRVVTVETGTSPVPVDGLRFDTRSRAERASNLARQYRRALRRRDPRTPRRQLIVETTPEAAPSDRGRDEPSATSGTTR
jgi:hypothetical protein